MRYAVFVVVEIFQFRSIKLSQYQLQTILILCVWQFDITKYTFTFQNITFECLFFPIDSCIKLYNYNHAQNSEKEHFFFFFFIVTIQSCITNDIYSGYQNTFVIIYNNIFVIIYVEPWNFHVPGRATQVGQVVS